MLRQYFFLEIGEVSNNNVIYSKTLELRSNNRGTVPLKASEVLEINWGGEVGGREKR